MRPFKNLILLAAGLGLAGLGAAACKTPAPVPAGGDPAVEAQAAAPATAPAAVGATTGAPKLEVSEKTAELGSVRQGEKATHTFVLRNVGTDVLHIRKAKGS